MNIRFSFSNVYLCLETGLTNDLELYPYYAYQT